jgi:hypothetical protein
MQKKKKRYDSITVTTGDGTESITVSVNRDGSIAFGDQVFEVFCQETYERSGKREKVVWRVPQEGPGPYRFDIENKLSNTEHLFAVDTNTTSVHDRKLSIVAFVHMERAFFVNRNGAAKAIHVVKDMHCLECYDIDPPQENFGWKYSLMYIQKRLNIKQNFSMIVDSDLGNLCDYNAQMKPFYKNCYVPASVSLIYASSDTGNDSVLNAAISLADKAASKVRCALDRGHPPRDGAIWAFR